MISKKNILLKKIYFNYLKNPDKIIISDNQKSLSWREIINYSIHYSLKFSKIKNKYVPIIVNRRVETIIVILALVLSNKVFCPISSAIPPKEKN